MKIDPLKRPCICGDYRYFTKWDYIRMILFGGLSYQCKSCGRIHNYKLCYYAIEKFDKDTREKNREIIDKQEKVMENG